jgi:NitT/TauT family transport system ATP-binding protein
LHFDASKNALSMTESLVAFQDQQSDKKESGIPFIAIKGAGKVFANGTDALSDVSLTIPQDPQFLALLGPSGCGKSTLLRMLAKLEAPTTGQIEWPGFHHGGARGTALDLGYVFQEPTLMPWATVFENVCLPLRIKGLHRSDFGNRVTEVLDRVGLREFSGAYPRQLSGGMRMRVSVARALVTEPRLLLLDEPFAALDEITRLKLDRDLLDIWLASPLTVVFVTHSVFEAVFLADRVVVMTPRPGRIAADLKIGAPYPRTEEFRTSTAYIELCREVSKALARAMGTHPV